MNLVKAASIFICIIGISTLTWAKLSGSLSAEAIAERLKPMGVVNVAGEPAAGAQTAAATAGQGTPQQIFENNCKMCHATGVAGAPKFGNKADWAPRIAQGLDTLVHAAIHGLNAMPPRGNCLKCTDAEIKATVEYMVHAAQ